MAISYNYLYKYQIIKVILYFNQGKDDTTQLIRDNASGTTGQTEEVEDPIETNDTMLGTSNETFEEPKKESKFINLK